MRRPSAWGLACALAILAAISFISLLKPGFDKNTEANVVISLIAGLVVAGGLLWRSRHFSSTNRVALWIEERIPALHYSLVTALEHGASPFSKGMEAAIERQNIGGVTLEALRRSVVPGVVAVAVAGVLLYISPSAAFGRAGMLGRLTNNRTASALVGSKLDDIEARITPPAYTGERQVTIEDPTSIAALIGSRIVIHGRGSAAGVTAAAGSPIAVVDADGGWSLSISMPTKPAALTLKDREYERIIVLDPHVCSKPCKYSGRLPRFAFF